MRSRFVVHRHKAGRPHFDLRLIGRDRIRSWSLLREPPCRRGESRLAIERESLSPEEMNRQIFSEDAFGEGKGVTWDEGDVCITQPDSKKLILVFMGRKLAGDYELSRTAWYPGNRWLLRKTRPPGKSRGNLA